MTESTTIIGFDQHAATTVAAVLLPGHRTPALHPLTSDLPTLGRFVDRLRRQGPVRCCYEAGPCGFELQRFMAAHHVPCESSRRRSFRAARETGSRPIAATPASSRCCTVRMP